MESLTSVKSVIRGTGRQRALFSPTVTVAGIEDLSPGFTRVTLSGDSFADYRDPFPADGFKLMLADDTEVPRRGEDGLPTWRGEQPVLRALTVRSFDSQRLTITADVARHDHGVLADWLSSVTVGDTVSFSGMRREWALPDAVDRVVLCADPAGLPAAASIVDALPSDCAADLVVDVRHDGDLALIPRRDTVSVHVVDDLGEVGPDLLPHLRSCGRVQGWIAAETSVVRHLRGVLKNGWGIAAADMLARAYWTKGRDGTAQDAADLVSFRRAVETGGDVHDPELAERISLGGDR
ncbi:siderophore-interacting protein [Corynebacterium sp.]|uniref:siderophore-interacting protein n=1 Tax=Corynebacterium sp. TaxID=1720 RepID=UPI003B3B781F